VLRPAAAGPICLRCELPGVHTDEECLEALRGAVARLKPRATTPAPRTGDRPLSDQPLRSAPIVLYSVWFSHGEGHREIRGRYATVAEALEAGRRLRRRYPQSRLLVAAFEGRWHRWTVGRPIGRRRPIRANQKPTNDVVRCLTAANSGRISLADPVG